MPTFDIDESAPAQGAASILVEVPIRTVWTRLSDIGNWPSWNEAVTRVDVEDAALPGSTFSWTAGGLRIRSQLQRVDPPVCIGWTGRAPMISARHIYRLTDQGDTTLVETEESFSGILPRLFPRMCSRMIVSALEQGLAALKAACEREDAGHARPAGTEE